MLKLLNKIIIIKLQFEQNKMSNMSYTKIFAICLLILNISEK